MLTAIDGPSEKFYAQGKVRDIKTRWRLFLFPKRYALIEMDPKDVEQLERELVRRFPFHPSLGSRGPAIPLSELDDPTKYPIGQHVEMTFVMGNPANEYFLGHPDLALNAIRPIEESHPSSE